jgi:hypothetical protein
MTSTWSPAICDPGCPRRLQWALLQNAKQQKSIIAPVCKDYLAVWVPMQAWMKALVEELEQKLAVADCTCSEFELDLFV